MVCGFLGGICLDGVTDFLGVLVGGDRVEGSPDYGLLIPVAFGWFRNVILGFTLVVFAGVLGLWFFVLWFSSGWLVALCCNVG